MLISIQWSKSYVSINQMLLPLLSRWQKCVLTFYGHTKHHFQEMPNHLIYSLHYLWRCSNKPGIGKAVEATIYFFSATHEYQFDGLSFLFKIHSGCVSVNALLIMACTCPTFQWIFSSFPSLSNSGSRVFHSLCYWRGIQLSQTAWKTF